MENLTVAQLIQYLEKMSQDRFCWSGWNRGTIRTEKEHLYREALEDIESAYMALAG